MPTVINESLTVEMGWVSLRGTVSPLLIMFAWGLDAASYAGTEHSSAVEDILGLNVVTKNHWSVLPPLNTWAEDVGHKPKLLCSPKSFHSQWQGWSEFPAILHIRRWRKETWRGSWTSCARDFILEPSLNSRPCSRSFRCESLELTHADLKKDPSTSTPVVQGSCHKEKSDWLLDLAVASSIPHPISRWMRNSIFFQFHFSECCFRLKGASLGIRINHRSVGKCLHRDTKGRGTEGPPERTRPDHTNQGDREKGCVWQPSVH